MLDLLRLSGLSSSCRIRTVAAAMLIASGISASAAQAQTEESNQTTSQARATAALLGGATGGVAAVQEYLAEGGGGPDVVAARARALLQSLVDDGALASPELAQQVASTISDAVEDALTTVPTVQVDLSSDLKLPEGARAFDLGPPDADVPPGFERVTARDARLQVDGERALRRPGASGVQQDGVFNVKTFQTGLPNGKWRIIVLTDPLAAGDGAGQAFGQHVRLNGNSIRIGSQQGFRGNLGRPRGPVGTRTAGSGMLLLEAEVTDGRLVIDFGENSSAYVTGIIFEPAEGTSIVNLDTPTRGYFDGLSQSRARARTVVAEALGEVLTQVVTAAGPQQVANALQTNQAITQSTVQVSEN